MILEGIVTTRQCDGQVHVAAMGATVTDAMDSFLLRPFQSSETFRNLQRARRGIFHVTDDVELLVGAALGRGSIQPTTVDVSHSGVPVLVDCCRWYAFQVTGLDDHAERATLTCGVTEQGRQRDFFGFNRAKHAILELTILATRIDLVPAKEIHDELERTQKIVLKTAGSAEIRAFGVVAEYIIQYVT